jgi:hypothetical protein
MIVVYELNPKGTDLQTLTDEELITLIVAGVKAALLDRTK